MDLTILDLECLKTTRSDYIRRVTDLRLEKDKDNKSTIKQLTDDINEIQKEINKRVETENKHGVKQDNPKASSYMSIELKNMSYTILNEVPVFSSGLDVHIWINKLDTYHKLYVAKDKSGVMEGHFVKNVLSRICPEYLSPMMSDSVTIDTYDDIKNYLKQNHASKLSNFQILDTVWEEDKKESETLRDFAIRLDEKAGEAKNIIIAKFREWKKEKNPSDDTTMSVDDMMKLVSGQVFLQFLKNKHQVVYNSICNDLDKTWNATEISLKAMTYSDRLVSEDSNMGAPAAAFPARFRDTRRSSDHCWHFVKHGTCKYQNCKYLHDKDAVKKKKDDEKAEKQKDDKPKAHTAFVPDEYTGIHSVIPMPEYDFIH